MHSCNDSEVKMDISEQTNSIKQSHEEEIKVYRIRWVILGLYVISCASSTVQWIQYSIIANIIVDYYQVSYTAVEWTSMIYLLSYSVLIFPGCYILDTWGLRKAVLFGLIGTSLGAWMKVASVYPNKFWLVLLGQGVIGCSQVFLLAIPPKLAAVWFGPKEVASACSIGVLGVQLGTAIGFVLPPIIVQSKDDVEYGLPVMLIGIAVINTVLLIVLVIFFEERPPNPPSPAQAQINEKRELVTFRQSLKVLFTNQSYVLLILLYGINLGVFYAISQLLNQIILDKYPDAAVDAGRIGLIVIITGMVGSITCGIILDVFNKFKETVIMVCTMGLISMIAFTFTLDVDIIAVYSVSVFTGFFISGFIPVGYELAIEITYPIEEGTSAGIITAISQLFGISFTYLYSFLFNIIGDKTTNLIMCSLLGLGLLILVFIRFDLRRQAIQAQDKQIKNLEC